MTVTELTLDEIIDRVETDGAISLTRDEAPDTLRKAVTRLELTKRQIMVEYQEDAVLVHKDGVRIGPAGTIVQRFRVTMVVEASCVSEVRQRQWAIDTLEKVEALTDDE